MGYEALLAHIDLGGTIIWLATGAALGLGFRKVIMKWMTGEWK